MTTLNWTRRRLLTGMPLLCLPGRIQAQDPAVKRLLRVVVNSPAGGVPDLIARVVSKVVGESTSQTIVVDNKPGAGGRLAQDLVARAPADGSNFLMTTAGPHSIAPWIYRQVSYDPLRDFAAVARVANAATIMFSTNRLPVRTLPELIAYAHKNPGKLNYGTTGPGTLVHLAAALFAKLANIEVTHVPYKASTLLRQDLASGELHFAFLNILSTADATPLAVASEERAADLPALPTFAELGWEVQAIQWFGLVAPAGTPAGAIEQLSSETARALKSPEVAKIFRALASDPAFMGPARFDDFLRKQSAYWMRVVKATGIEPE